MFMNIRLTLREVANRQKQRDRRRVKQPIGEASHSLTRALYAGRQVLEEGRRNTVCLRVLLTWAVS